MADKFAEWFIETIFEIIENIGCVAKTVFGLAVIIILFPVWVIPFLYWYFNVREEREGEEEHDGSGSNQMD